MSSVGSESGKDAAGGKPHPGGGVRADDGWGRVLVASSSYAHCGQSVLSRPSQCARLQTRAQRVQRDVVHIDRARWMDSYGVLTVADDTVQVVHLQNACVAEASSGLTEVCGAACMQDAGVYARHMARFG